jgi:hypothetical protein
MPEERIFVEAEELKIEGLFENFGGEKEVVISHPHPLYGGSMHKRVMEGSCHLFGSRKRTARERTESLWNDGSIEYEIWSKGGVLCQKRK